MKILLTTLMVLISVWESNAVDHNLCPNSTLAAQDGCCQTMKCHCWGDPHCIPFKSSIIFDNLGTCKYDYVTTDCINNKLPANLRPFNVRLKLEAWGIINFVEVNIMSTQFRMMRNKTFLVNGVERSVPYSVSDDIKVFLNGKFLTLVTSFGVEVIWEGTNHMEVKICDSYAGHVCGMCGDGIVTDERLIVDRNKQPIFGQDKDEVLSIWAGKWRVPDDSPNVDFTKCEPGGAVSRIATPKCENPLVYLGPEWCGRLRDTNGPWRQCLDRMDQSLQRILFETCVYDVCALENNRDDQLSALCEVYAELTDNCLEISDELKLNWKFDWRPATNCSIECWENEVYDTRAECPKTCENPDGLYDCGPKVNTEGCYCVDGYVQFENSCVKADECGCRLPNENFLLELGKSFVSRDCRLNYTCESPRQDAKLSNRVRCDVNSRCIEEERNKFKCECLRGFRGNGFNCTKGTFGDSCSDSELCEERGGLVCRNGVCSCPNNQYWNKNMCLNVKSIGFVCERGEECDASKNLTCVRNVCQCRDLSLYFSEFQARCITKKTNGEQCSIAEICNESGGLICQGGVCSCRRSNYWKVDKCAPMSSFNQKCTGNEECDSSRNLVCKDGLCQCQAANLFWNERVSSCVPKLGINERCSALETCNDLAGLSCQNGVCRCATGFFWKDDKCVKLSLFNERCARNDECDARVNLICRDGVCVCRDVGLFWSDKSSSCVAKLTVNEKCSALEPCNDQAGLSCQDGVCKCAPDFWWNQNRCIKLSSFNQRCARNEECDGAKGLVCRNGLCQCQNTSFFWNERVSSCALKLTINERCSVFETCNDQAGLSCQDGVCRCASGFFWKDNKCVQLGLFNQRCLSNDECDGRKNLICRDGLCQCRDGNFFWSERVSSCVAKLSINERCSAVDICNDLVGLSCQNGVCRCGADFFWKDTRCVAKLTINQRCSAVDLCNDTAGLSCQNGVCNCGANFFWRDNRCIQSSSFNQRCSRNEECDANKNLICLNGVCQCRDNTLYWSERASNCVVKLTINERCSAADICNDLVGLSCQDGVCKCGGGFVWNQNKCVKMSSFMERCVRSDECNWNQSLVCRDGVCQCRDSGFFWNDKVSSCEIMDLSFMINYNLLLSRFIYTFFNFATTSEFYTSNLFNQMNTIFNQREILKYLTVPLRNFLKFYNSFTLSDYSNTNLPTSVRGNIQQRFNPREFNFTDLLTSRRRVFFATPLRNILIKPLNQRLADQPNIRIFNYNNEFDCLYECVMNYTDTKACYFNNTNNVCLIYTSSNYIIAREKNFDPKSLASVSLNSIIFVLKNYSIFERDNFDLFDNLEYTNLNLFSFSQADNLEDCLNKCEDNANCVSFNYDKLKKSCEMYNQNGTVTRFNSNKMSGYKIKADLSLIARLANVTEEQIFEKKKFFRVQGVNFNGNNLMEGFRSETVDDCENACGLNDLCFTYTYRDKSCFLKFRYIFTHTSVREATAVSGYPIIVKYCLNKIAQNESVEYLSTSVKYISNSNPEECCMSCYYNNECTIWQLHRLNKMCTLVLRGQNINSVNRNFISGVKPKLVFLN